MGLTREQAIELAESGFWETMTFEERAKFQISENRLCMPFSVFHEAVEKTIGRGVFTHEFGSGGIERIRAEIFDGAEPPSFQEIMDLIPADKQVIFVVPE